MDLHLIENNPPHRIEEYPGHGDLVEFPSKNLLRSFANRVAQPVGGGNHQQRGNSDHEENNKRGKERGSSIAKAMLQLAGTVSGSSLPLTGS